jgi:hypothetical protein
MKPDFWSLFVKKLPHERLAPIYAMAANVILKKPSRLQAL